MKISISYIPGEEAKAAFLSAMIRKHFKKVKVKESAKEPPRRHIYFKIAEPLDR